jgi:CubicO group peptidase (beta-lactamase class C family)
MKPSLYWHFLMVGIYSKSLTYSNAHDPSSLGEILVEILRGGIAAEIFPGAVAAWGSSKGVHFSTAQGHFTYNTTSSTPMTLPTIFDVASLTKVVATTSAVGLLFEEGYLSLDDTITDLLNASFSGPGGTKAAVTVRHCLTHSAGFPPDPSPWYWNQSFGCPLPPAPPPSPPSEDFRCLPLIFDQLMDQPLDTQPGEVFLYSDFSFITLMFTVGSVVLDKKLVDSVPLHQACVGALDDDVIYPTPRSVKLACAFEAFVRSRVFSVTLPSSTFLLDSALWPATAPTNNDSEYTLTTPLQGQVGDGDAFAMGGISGHAGLFSTMPDLANLASNLLRSLSNDHSSGPLILNHSTVGLFVQVQNSSMSSRALGWDTNLGTVNDYGFDSVCGDVLSSRTFLHIGYTGTCLCIDHESDFWSVVLTNRVFNCQGQLCPVGSENDVKYIFREFNIAAALESRKRGTK